MNKQLHDTVLFEGISTHNFLIQRTLLNVITGGDIPIVLINPHHHPMKIHKDQLIGLAATYSVQCNVVNTSTDGPQCILTDEALRQIINE